MILFHQFELKQLRSTLAQVVKENEFAYILGEIQESVLIINNSRQKLSIEYVNSKFLDTFRTIIGSL